jgi:hypothetical protein
MDEPPPDDLFSVFRDDSEFTERDRRKHKLQKDQVGSEDSLLSPSGSFCLPSVNNDENHSTLVRRCIPHDRKQWKRSLFKLARFLHDKPGDKMPAVNAWIALSDLDVPRPVILMEWTMASANVKFGTRIDLDAVYKRVQENGFATWISDEFPEQPLFHLVTAFCVELAREVYPAETFWLSCRDLGEVVGISHTYASRMLTVLVKRDILEMVEKGGPHSNKATRFKLLRGRR